MANNINKVIKALSDRDIEALTSIYMYRCLSQNQIYELHYMENVRTKQIISDDSCKKSIKSFLSFELVEEEEYTSRTAQGGVDSNMVYFLTSFGVEIVRSGLDLPNSIYDSEKMAIRRAYFRASELRLHPKLINHQIHLNNFVIDFRKLKINETWKYFDEKYVSQYTNIRPDGMISMLDTDFFLEMDMSTESKNQLFEKWENYRSFLNSREYSYREKKIVVLFIVDNSSRLEERINLIKYTIYERLIDVLDSDFEIYVGTRETLLTLLTDKLIPSIKEGNIVNNQIKSTLIDKHGFSVSNGEEIRHIFEGTEYGLYIRKINELNNIVVENKKVQEFIVDEYSYCPMSVLSKIAYIDKNNTFFRHKFNREICYIVVAESENQIYDNLKLVDLIGVKNVYFTTIRRLNNSSFHEALFQFDFLGNLHHFANSGLEERIFEMNIKV